MACARLIRSKIADTSSFSQTEFVLVHVRESTHVWCATHVCFGPKADMPGAYSIISSARLSSDEGLYRGGPQGCPLWVKSGILKLNRRVSSTRRDLLPARSRNKAPDLCPAFIVLVGPHDGQPELVWSSHQRVGRYLDPLAVKSHPIFSIFRIPIHILDGLAISH